MIHILFMIFAAARFSLAFVAGSRYAGQWRVYSGIITFFIWGLLIARLQAKAVGKNGRATPT